MLSVIFWERPRLVAYRNFWGSTENTGPENEGPKGVSR